MNRYELINVKGGRSIVERGKSQPFAFFEWGTTEYAPAVLDLLERGANPETAIQVGVDHRYADVTQSGGAFHIR